MEIILERLCQRDHNFSSTKSQCIADNIRVVGSVEYDAKRLFQLAAVLASFGRKMMVGGAGKVFERLKTFENFGKT